jgi:hypothetical protein
VGGVAGTGGETGGAGGTGGTSGSSGTAGSSGSGGTPAVCQEREREVCSTTPGARGGCFQSIRICSGGEWGECRDVPSEMIPGGEVCNGEDEDCDGEIDEDLGEFSCGLGACRRTVSACKNGIINACIPGTPATSVDSCNDVDDDCDGSVDEDCGDCVRVAPTGDDVVAAAGDGSSPFRNIQPAIDFAALNGFNQVCVAAGSSCGASASYPGPGSGELTMQNGVSVLGSYESTGWTRCTNSPTTIVPATARGVYFPVGITDLTALDGFTVERATASTTAGVTIEGARGVVLSNLTVVNAPAATHSYGVNLTSGGEATVVRSRITAGGGSVESIGLRAVGAKLTVEDNCLSPDPLTGRCDDDCASGFSIQGRSPLGNGPTYAILLEESPDSRIERSAVCADARTLPLAPVAAIRIHGDAEGIVVRGSNVLATMRTSNTFTQGVSLGACDDATPWIVDNNKVSARYVSASSSGGTTSTHQIDGIRAEGACHPRIDSNRWVETAPFSSYQTLPVAAVRCGSAAGTASRCVVSKNGVFGAGAPYAFGFLRVAGIVCTDGACAKISRNEIVGHVFDHIDGGLTCVNSCQTEAYGLWISDSGALVDRNAITAGCITEGGAIRAENSFSRIQNNVLKGRVCNWYNLRHSWEKVLHVFHGSAGNALDVHSNSIEPSRTNPMDNSVRPCDSTGNSAVVWLDTLAGATPPPLGIYRNNFLNGVGCAQTTLSEFSLSADPAVLEFNDMEEGRAIGGMYFDRDSANPYLDLDQMNALTDITVAGNSYPDGQPGTSVGAPLWDYDGNPRDDSPSVGPYED